MSRNHCVSPLRCVAMCNWCAQSTPHRQASSGERANPLSPRGCSPALTGSSRQHIGKCRGLQCRRRHTASGLCSIQRGHLPPGSAAPDHAGGA